jgi:hypothetical protein
MEIVASTNNISKKKNAKEISVTMIIEVLA